MYTNYGRQLLLVHDLNVEKTSIRVMDNIDCFIVERTSPRAQRAIEIATSATSSMHQQTTVFDTNIADATSSTAGAVSITSYSHHESGVVLAGPSVFVPRSQEAIEHAAPRERSGIHVPPVAEGLSQQQVARVGTPTSSLLPRVPAAPCTSVSTPMEMAGENDTAEEVEKDSPPATEHGSSKQPPTRSSRHSNDHSLLWRDRQGAVNPTTVYHSFSEVGVSRPRPSGGHTTCHVAQRQSSLPHTQHESPMRPEAIVDPVQMLTTGSATAASSASTHHHHQQQRSFSEGITRPNTIRIADSGTEVQPQQSSSLPGYWPESQQLLTKANDNPTQVVQRASSAPVVSQRRLVTVDADVLDQVVKFAAISCQLTMPDRGSLEDHERNLYQMLRGDIDTPQGEKNVDMPRGENNVDRPYGEENMEGPQGERNVDTPQGEKNNCTPQEEGSIGTPHSESSLLKGLLTAPRSSNVNNTTICVESITIGVGNPPISVDKSTVSGTCSSVCEATTTTHSGHRTDDTSINSGSTSIVHNTTIYSQTKTIPTTKDLTESVEVRCSLSSSTPARRTNSKRPNPSTDPDVIVIGDESPPDQKKLKLSQVSEQIKTTSTFEIGCPNSSTHSSLSTTTCTSNSTITGLLNGEKCFDNNSNTVSQTQTQKSTSLFQSRTNETSSVEEPPLRLSVNEFEGDTTSGTYKLAHDNVYTAASANVSSGSDIMLQSGESPAISQLLSLSNPRRENSGVDHSQSQTGPTGFSRLTDHGASSDSSVGAGPSTSAAVRSKRKKRVRCGKCANCLLPSCGQCKYCLDKPRYHSVCKDLKSKPCLTWDQGGQSSSSTAPPVSHPPTLSQLRILPQTTTDSEDDSDEEFHARIDQALKEGYVEIFTAKCGVSGPPGTGKSHFRALVSGKDRPRHRQSTALATEADQIIPSACVTQDFEEEMVELHRNKHGGTKVRWFVVSSKKLSQLIAKTIHNQTSGGRNVSAHLSSSVLQSSLGEAVLVSKREMSAIRKEIKKNLKALSKSKGKLKCLHKMKLLFLVDTGGQPQFQEIMPIFVRNSSMTLLVHKLNESLDDCPRFDYEINGVRYTVPEEMLVTNREYLEQSLRTICSCTFSRNISSRATSRRNPKPHFAVVGMFKDQCSDRMLAEKNKGVSECIKPFTQSKKCVPLTPSRNVDCPVFAIDGSEAGWSTNGNVIDDLHTHIERVTEGLGVKIPIRWFLFRNLLKEHSKNAPYLSLQQCYEIARREDIMMDKEDVDEALLLFDELNLILYFPHVLRDTVFCSPEFLYNKVSEIIAQSFDCDDPRSSLTRWERSEFRKTGIFTKSLLERVKSIQEGFDQVVFKIDNLLYLLVKLCIIAPVGPDRYFIPCVLALQRREHNSILLMQICYHMVELGVEPLLITFPEGYSPRGLFCASVAHLAKLSNWIVESPTCQLERKRNLIEFELRELVRSEREVQRAAPLGRVVITDMVSHIQVYSTCEKEHLCDIRRAIYGALWYAATCLSYSPTDVEVNVGFTCTVDCGISEKHGTAVSFNSKTQRRSSKCVKNSSKRAKPLTAEQEAWFTSSDGPGSSTGPSTSLLELMNEVATQTNKWECIALELELSHNDIERINLEAQGRIQDCFRRVFSKWETKVDPPFTWPVIIRALESPSVMEFRLALELKRKYLAVTV